MADTFCSRSVSPRISSNAEIGHLHDLGEIEVKHDVRVQLVNFNTEDLGNPEVPRRFKAAPSHAP